MQHVQKDTFYTIVIRVKHEIHFNVWDAYYLAVHVVLSFNEFPPVHLPGVGLAGNDVALSFMKDFDWHSNGHLSEHHHKYSNDFSQI